MNTTKIIITTLVLALALGFAGCKKKEQPAAPAKEMSMKDMQMQAADANKTAAETAAPGEQTLCPVTGDKIDPNVFVEYKGKKVYFCCSMCVAQFNKNPEKYIAKLPQFAK